MLIGTRVAHLAIGKDGKDLFHATILNRFVLLTCTYSGEATRRAHAELQRMASRWIDKVTIVCAATKASDEKWNSVEAVLYVGVEVVVRGWRQALIAHGCQIFPLLTAVPHIRYPRYYVAIPSSLQIALTLRRSLYAFRKYRCIGPCGRKGNDFSSWVSSSSLSLSASFFASFSTSLSSPSSSVRDM